MKEILRLAIPALGALLAEPIVSLVDTAFVGRLGPEALGALGINVSVLGLASWLFVFLAYGTTPLVAEARGRGEDPREIIGQAMWLALGLGLAAGAGLWILAVPICQAMGAEGALLEATLAYLHIRALGVPAILLITAGNGVFRGFEDTRTPLAITMGLGLVNLILDPLFIFGFGWGLEGAALASVIAQVAGAGAFLFLLRHKLRGWPNVRHMMPLVRIGREMLIRGAALVGTMTVATAVATRVGVSAVAAHQVAIQVWLLLAYATDALAVAAQALVARDLGRGDLAGARAVGTQVLRLGGVGGVLFLLLLLALGPSLGAVITPDRAVQVALAEVLVLVALLQPINALVFVFDGIFMGAQRFQLIAWCMVVSAAVAWPVLFAVQPMGWGLQGVWIGVTVFMFARGVTLGWYYWGPRAILRDVGVA